MKQTGFYLAAMSMLLVFSVACTTEGRFRSGYKYDDGETYDYDVTSEYGSNRGGSQSGSDVSGLLTAGEWNDLDNWSFWKHLMRSQDSVEYYKYPQYWGYSTKGRIPVKVMCGGKEVVNATVSLKNAGETVWTARTDVFGKAELWAGLSQLQDSIEEQNRYVVEVDGVECRMALKFDSLNVVEIQQANQVGNRVELAFIVDATGSMSDEIKFLKADMQQVVKRVAQQTSSDILVGSVFYRDDDDDYVVRHSDFTDKISAAAEFISQQSADGGGDYPEAVHKAFESALGDLQWSSGAKTRIAFLVADAPAHYETSIINRLHEQMMRFAAKGIKIIPVASSGVDKETEFLFRYFAMATNGTYVFLTDDSGIGYSHIEPTVGDYDVEYLDDLLVRLIYKYTTGD